MNKIPVALVDDDQLIVSLLKDFINQQSNLEVIMTANSHEAFLAILESEAIHPKVLILDLKMKDSSGLETASLLKTRYPDISVVIMSSFYKSQFMGIMLKSGVSAFIPKGLSPESLLTIIHDVAKNGFYFLEEQVNMLRTQISSKSPIPALESKDELTEREIEVLILICHQKTAKEIGEILFISTRTVEGHKNNLFLKTGTKNIAGLVIYSIQNGFIHIDDIALLP